MWKAIVARVGAAGVAGALAVWALALGATQVQAQDCDALFAKAEACVEECAAACADDDCRAACNSNPQCLDAALACIADAPAAAMPETGGAASRSLSLDMALPGGPLDARIYALTRGETEPDALFYGYLIVGPNVSDKRKSAVAKGFACRLDVISSEDAVTAERLGLVAIPARTSLDADVISPAEFLDAYDFPRAERWLRAVGFSVGEEFDIAESVLFVGSREARAAQFDAVALPVADDNGDPVIADASALSARYLERWTFDIIAAVREGRMQSRQDMQNIMEWHSFFETIGEPIAAVLRIGPAVASELPPPACY